MEQRRSACDACRRRRVRCNAVQPCDQCTRSGITCTYGSTINRQSATAYARNLEQQVAALHLQLQALTHPTGRHSPPTFSPSPNSQDQPDFLVKPNDGLVLQQSNGTKVYRYSAALNVIRAIADMIGGENTVGGADAGYQPGRVLVEIFETQIDLPVQANVDWLRTFLPSRKKLWNKLSRAIEIGLICFDCIDVIPFKARLDAMLDEPDNNHTQERKSFLALVYALLALGELYDGISDREPTVGGLEAGRLCGLDYFRASRCIVRDEHQHTNLDTVTALFLHSRYLLSSSTFSHAHEALCVAIAAAMHMGLHLDDASLPDGFSEDERFNRRRVLACINAFETVIAFSLGVPRMLRAADPKQILGLRDGDLIDEGNTMIDRDATTLEAETVLSQKLIRIYSKMLDQNFEQSVESRPSLNWISEVDAELKEWEQCLPPISDTFATQRRLRGQLTMRLNYTGIYMAFTAPCLHHLSRKRTDPTWNLAGYDYGSACIHAAAESVYILQAMETKGFLGHHWLHNYLLAWAAIILSYFVINSPIRVTTAESKHAALLAYEILGRLGETNDASKRIHECTASFIDRLSNTPAE